MKISEMRESVNKKRIELDFLRRSKTLTSILEAQVRLPILLKAYFYKFEFKSREQCFQSVKKRQLFVDFLQCLYMPIFCSFLRNQLMQLVYVCVEVEL